MRKQTIRNGWTKIMQRALHHADSLVKKGAIAAQLAASGLPGAGKLAVLAQRLHDEAIELRSSTWANWKKRSKPKARQPAVWQPNNRKDASGRTLRWENNALVPRFAI
jgi:hypothetical protein